MPISQTTQTEGMIIDGVLDKLAKEIEIKYNSVKGYQGISNPFKSEIDFTDAKECAVLNKNRSLINKYLNNKLDTLIGPRKTIVYTSMFKKPYKGTNNITFYDALEIIWGITGLQNKPTISSKQKQTKNSGGFFKGTVLNFFTPSLELKLRDYILKVSFDGKRKIFLSVAELSVFMSNSNKIINTLEEELAVEGLYLQKDKTTIHKTSSYVMFYWSTDKNLNTPIETTLSVKQIYEQNKTRMTCIKCNNPTEVKDLFTSSIKYCKECCG